VLDFMLHETNDIIGELVVYPEKMLANLNMSGGLIFSQKVLLALVDGGMDRQEAYRLVQRHAHAAPSMGRPFRELIAEDPEVIQRIRPEQIESIFDPWEQLQHVDATFERLGLVETGVARA
jgi:adenylosuccinate lyase